jgi:hypothetical protein
MRALQIIRTAGLQLGPKHALICALLRALETGATISIAWKSGAEAPGFTRDRQGAAARAAWLAVLLAATSAAGVAASAAGDYCLRHRFLLRAQAADGPPAWKGDQPAGPGPSAAAAAAAASPAGRRAKAE